jgi:integrase
VWLKPRKTNRWRKYTLGTYPEIGLARAREGALRLRTAIIDGHDPFETRALGRSCPSVRELGDTFIKRHSKVKKRSWSEDERMLTFDVVPALGDCRADLITKVDIVRLLDAIHDRGAPIQANRTLALLRKLFAWSIAEGYLQTPNPAAGIPMRAKEIARKRVLNDNELRSFWHALDGPGFDDVTADALRLELLMGARIGEITGMERTELKLDQAIPLWVLPAAKAKGNLDVARPLTGVALKIVSRRVVAAGNSSYVFVSPVTKLQPIISQAPTRALRRAGEAGCILSLPEKTIAKGRAVALTASDRAAFWSEHGFRAHDLRRTARTYWAKLGVMPEIARKLLGHVPPKSDVDAAVYNQHAFIDEMCEALAKWERALLAIVTRAANVEATGLAA